MNTLKTLQADEKGYKKKKQHMEKVELTVLMLCQQKRYR